MKVYEIIVEEQKQINEALPLLGGLTAAGVLGAVSLFLTAWTVYDIYSILKKRNFDIDSMSEGDYIDLGIDVLILAIPGLGKLARGTVVKLTPDWLKKQIATMVKGKIAPLRTQLKGDLKTAKTAATSAERQSLKSAAVTQYTAAAEKVYAKNVVGPIKLTIGAIGATTMAVDYYSQLMDLEDQWDRLCNKNDTTTPLFGDISCERATEIADQHRKKLLGELTIGVGAAIAAAPLAKLVSGFGNIVGTVTGFATGSRLVGGIVKLPATITAKLISLGGVAIPYIMQTEEGKKFLSNAVFESITSTVGALTSGTLSLLYAAIEKVAEKLGLDAKPITDPLKSKIAAAQDKNFSTKYKEDPAPTPQLSVRKDPANPKIVSVGGIQITDATGKRIASDTVIKQIQKTADAWDYPDPTAGLGT